MDSSSCNVLTALRYRVLYPRNISTKRWWWGSVTWQRTSDISPLVSNTCAMGCSNCPNRLSYSAIRRPCPIAANACRKVTHISCDKKHESSRMKRHTCLPDRFFGRLGMSILLSPTPIAPELTRTTLWPWFFNCMTVSTTEESVESNGWCVCSWTIDDVPTSFMGLMRCDVREVNSPNLMTTVQGPFREREFERPIALIDQAA